MKQRVVIRAIVKKDGKILLLRRAGGRPSIEGLYELPGGKLHNSEQPVDTLRRTLATHAGVLPETLQLFDVITYVDPEDREVQYTFIVYMVSLPVDDDKIIPAEGYDKYIWRAQDEIGRTDVTNSTSILLGLDVGVSDAAADAGDSDVKETTDVNKLIIYSDGGSRGNPGPSASGFVIMDTDENVLFEGGEYLGLTTNNQAEYTGVRLALEKAAKMGGHVIDFRMDSLLVVNQLNGVYKIRNKELWPIHDRIKELLANFDRVTFSHVPRELNTLADGMVNKILDQESERRAGEDV